MVKILQLTIPLNELPVLSSVHSNNAQSIPLNDAEKQSHLLSTLQLPPFRHLLSSPPQEKPGHDPSSEKSTPPGQGVAEVVGVPLNTYNKY